MFSKEATKNDEIHHRFDIICSKCKKVTIKISSMFVAFLENMNFTLIYQYQILGISL